MTKYTIFLMSKHIAPTFGKYTI